MTSKGLLLRVRLMPNASRDQIDAIVMLPNDVCVVKARVRAIPEKGKANKAVLKLFAKAIGLAPSKLSLASGAKDRNKEILIEDLGEQVSMVRDWLGTIEGTLKK